MALQALNGAAGAVVSFGRDLLGGAHLRLPEGMSPANTDLVLTVGQAGAGKSQFVKDMTQSFGSSMPLLNSRGEMSTPFEQMAAMTDGSAGTKVCMAYAFKDPRKGHRNLVVLDTPGFNDADIVDTTVYAEIVGMLSVYSSIGGLSLKGVLYLIEISTDRIFSSAKWIRKILEALLGREFVSSGRFVVVTTKWDRVASERTKKLVFEADLLRQLGCPANEIVIRHQCKDSVGLVSSLFQKTSSSADLVFHVLQQSDITSSKVPPVAVLEELKDNGNDIKETAAFWVADEAAGGHYARAKLAEEEARKKEEEERELQRKVRRLEEYLRTVQAKLNKKERAEEEQNLKEHREDVHKLQKEMHALKKESEEALKQSPASAWTKAFDWVVRLGAVIADLLINLFT